MLSLLLFGFFFGCRGFLSQDWVRTLPFSLMLEFLSFVHVEMNTYLNTMN